MNVKITSKRIVAGLAVLILALSLTACFEKTPMPRTTQEIGADAVSIVQTDLTDEEKRAALDAYAETLTLSMEGNACSADFVEMDEQLILVFMPDGSDNKQEMQRFNNLDEAFAFYVYTGQINESGEIKASPITELPNDYMSK